jgi:hypothetical protein
MQRKNCSYGLDGAFSMDFVACQHLGFLLHFFSLDKCNPLGSR